VKTRESVTMVMSSDKLFLQCMQNIRQWNDALHAHPSRIFHTKCDEHNGKTVNAMRLSLALR